MKRTIKLSVMALVAMFAFSTVVDAQELETYTGTNFIIQHPAEFVGEDDDWGAGANQWKMDDNHLLTCWYDDDVGEDDDWGAGANQWKMDDNHLLTCWYDDDACKIVEFDMFAAVQKIGMEDKGMTCGDPVINGKICTLRGVKDNQVEYAYVVYFGIKTDSECLRGKFRCLVSDEAKYKPILDTILSTMQLK